MLIRVNSDMETQERKVCKLCLKICEKFLTLDGDTKDVLDIILPNIKLTSVQEPVMCTNCAEKLFKCFDFKAECFYTHDYIVPFIDYKDTVKLDLKDVYLIKNENCTAVPEDHDICGFCMDSVKNCFSIFLGVGKGDVLLEKMIRQCLPELDLSIIKKPVICPTCRGSLETCFRFVMDCLSVEDKIKKYCETLDVDSNDQIKLSHLLQFTMRAVTTGEADGNLVNVIKEEKQLCEERENADDMDNMIFGDGEEFIIDNVSACKEESKNLDVIKMEEGLFEENYIKEENLEKVEDQKYLHNEEIDIKTNESDFYRLEDGVVLPRPKVTTRLCVRLERLMPILKRDLSKPYVKQKLTNENSSRKMYKCDSCLYQTRYKHHFQIHLVKHMDPSEVTMYKCDSCFYQTKYERDLKRHSVKHKDQSEVTMYKCDSCSFQAIYKSYLTTHLVKHKDRSEVTMYKCYSCSFQTKRRSDLIRHLLVHKDPLKVTMLKCGSCSFQTKHKDSLRTHLVLHKDRSEVTVYKCDSCSFEAVHKEYLKMHSLVHKDRSEITMYKCDFCSFETKRRNYLYRHLLVHKNPLEVTMHKCDSCSFQTKHKNDLRKHLLVHKDPLEVTMFKCGSCSFQTKYKDNYSRHLVVHKDRSELTIYKCDSCAFQTIHKEYLKKHSMGHKDRSEVTMYKCDSCSFQTRHRNSLSGHLLIHKNPSEVTMHKCDSCSFQTKRKNELRQHMLIHKDPLKVTSFKCDFCSYQTRYKKNYGRHLLKHKDRSEVTMYKCASCSYQTKYKESLKRHVHLHKNPFIATPSTGKKSALNNK